MKYCVYCHTNMVNGKKYIGITSQKPERRWANGKGYRTLAFGRAIKKYGWENFYHEILFDNLSRETACSMEKYLIEKYRTCERQYGYNQSIGGNVPTDNAREILRQRMTGEKNPMYNKPKPENNLKATRKAVYCVETGVAYESISKASKMTGVNLGHIASNCKGKRKSAGGFHWKYIMIVGGEYG